MSDDENKKLTEFRLDLIEKRLARIETFILSVLAMIGASFLVALLTLVGLPKPGG